MAEPASKKLKTSHDNNGKRRIIPLSSGRLEPDTCLMIMDTLEFHVHPHILKLHSTIFREKFAVFDNKPPVNAAFKYKLVAVLNEHRCWAWHQFEFG
jgi:hypothetical protein